MGRPSFGVVGPTGRPIQDGPKTEDPSHFGPLTSLAAKTGSLIRAVASLKRVTTDGVP